MKMDTMLGRLPQGISRPLETERMTEKELRGVLMIAEKRIEDLEKEAQLSNRRIGELQSLSNIRLSSEAQVEVNKKSIQDLHRRLSELEAVMSRSALAG